MGKVLHDYFKFILLNNIFISLCAVGLCMESAVLFHEPFREFTFYAFIFFGTLFTYNVYYLQDKYHPVALSFTIVGLAGTAIAFFMLDTVSWYHLIIIGILSVCYILPGYIGLKRTKFYLVFKLFILVIVWTHATFFLPIPNHTYDVETFLLYAYRFMLMWNLCLLFFIKDEIEKFKSYHLQLFLAATLFIQFSIACIIAFNFQLVVGLIFILSSGILMLLSYLFFRHKKVQTDYLFYIDGMMLLESIFVLSLNYLL